MNTRTFIDKTKWPPGPWDDEPDKVQWVDENTGLVCLIKRGPAGVYRNRKLAAGWRVLNGRWYKPEEVNR